MELREELLVFMANNKEGREEVDGCCGSRRGGVRSSGERWYAKRKLTGAGRG